MTARPQRPADRAELARMEEARRATQRQLDLIERRIVHRMAGFENRRGRAALAHLRRTDPAFPRVSRELLAALTAERQPETDALSRKLRRQDRAIDAFRERHGLSRADL